tara:strand:+ start:794 stop:937 length:144 start_codon:yes stop_codon:yes gene_type:complete
MKAFIIEKAKMKKFFGCLLMAIIAGALGWEWVSVIFMFIALYFSQKS